MKKSHILIIVLAGTLLLSFNVFTTVKFYSLRADLNKRGIIDNVYEWGGFDAVKWIAYAEARNRVLWEEVKTNTNYIFHIENYLDIEQRYVKKRYVKKEKGE